MKRRQRLPILPKAHSARPCVGNSNLAQEGAAAALRLTNSRDVQFLAAMAYAAGE